MRLPAIPDEVLRRELHMLSDDIRLLPTQVIMVAGLSVQQLKDKRGFDPPKPPRPLPREKGHSGLWYSLGELRAYLASVKEQAEIDAELGRRPFERKLRFSAWLGSPHIDTRWPFALVGPHKRPVDLWATIRGDVPMSRNDKTAWLTRPAFLAALAAAEKAEGAAQERSRAVKHATKRQGQALAQAPTRSKGRRAYS